MTTKTTLTRPANLDSSKLHSPAEVRAHRAEVEAYFATVRSEAERLHKREEAARAEAQRPLTEDEYHAAAVIREAEQRSRIAEREAVEVAAAEAKAAYLESTPDIADIEASNPHHFLLQVIHWAARGYQMPEGADIATFPNWYAVKLVAPATAPAKK